MHDLPAAFAAIIAFLFISTQEKDNPAIGRYAGLPLVIGLGHAGGGEDRVGDGWPDRIDARLDRRSALRAIARYAPRPWASRRCAAPDSRRSWSARFCHP